MAKTKLYTFYMSSYGAPTKHVVKMASQSASYMDAVFELKAHEVSKNWASLPHIFTKEGLPQFPG